MNNENKTEEVFQCICGKQFNNKTSLRCHKSNCKIYQESVKDQKLKIQQEKEAKRLPNGMFKCENPDCGKEHEGSYGSGRFCCIECRRHYNSKIGNQTAIKNGNKKCNFNCNKTNNGRASYGTWKCSICGKIFETRAKLIEHNHQFHPIPKGQVWNKNLTKETDKRVAKGAKTLTDGYKSGRIIAHNKGKHHSEEEKQKISKSMKKYLNENPDKVPYILNHSSKESYPEQYFRTVFKNENFPLFVQNKYINGYFLDFAFEDKKVYIEIDGEQHYVDQKIIEHDKIRTEKLNTTEWKCICRIRWSKFQKLTTEQKIRFIQALKLRIETISFQNRKNMI